MPMLTDNSDERCEVKISTIHEDSTKLTVDSVAVRTKSRRGTEP